MKGGGRVATLEPSWCHCGWGRACACPLSEGSTTLNEGEVRELVNVLPRERMKSETKSPASSVSSNAKGPHF